MTSTGVGGWWLVGWLVDVHQVHSMLLNKLGCFIGRAYKIKCCVGTKRIKLLDGICKNRMDIDLQCIGRGFTEFDSKIINLEICCLDFSNETFAQIFGECELLFNEFQLDFQIGILSFFRFVCALLSNKFDSTHAKSITSHHITSLLITVTST